MTRKVLSALFVSALALAFALPAFAQGGAQIVATYTFGDVPLAALQNTIIPGSIANDRGMRLGGIGSDVWHVPGAPANELYMVTDRGPNGQIRVDGKNRRTFPVPDFTPIILHARMEADGGMTVLRAIPIVGQSGAPVTGLSNQSRDEKPYDYSAQVELALNPNGLDTEGLVRDGNGDFWLVDEYSPSLIHTDANGKVITRYVPAGLNLTGTDYPVSESLPGILLKRKGNRGFEGLALSPDGRTLFIALQSPLSNPNAATGDPSRNTRLLAFDVASKKVTAEYIYRFDVAAEFDPESPSPTEMKLSGLYATSSSQLLVLERTDKVAKVYAVNLGQGTNILGSAWDEAATAPSLEAQEEVAGTLAKSLVVNLDALPGMPDKIEGISMVDATTMAVINDNDFDVNEGTFDASGTFIPAGAKSQVLMVRLDTAPAGGAALPVSLPNTGGAEAAWPLAALLLGLGLLGAGLGLRRRA